MEERSLGDVLSLVGAAAQQSRLAEHAAGDGGEEDLLGRTISISSFDDQADLPCATGWHAAGEAGRGAESHKSDQLISDLLIPS
jgi:hypothetical protein